MLTCSDAQSLRRFCELVDQLPELVRMRDAVTLTSAIRDFPLSVYPLITNCALTSADALRWALCTCVGEDERDDMIVHAFFAAVANGRQDLAQIMLQNGKYRGQIPSTLEARAVYAAEVAGHKYTVSEPQGTGFLVRLQRFRGACLRGNVARAQCVAPNLASACWDGYRTFCAAFPQRRKSRAVLATRLFGSPVRQELPHSAFDLFINACGAGYLVRARRLAIQARPVDAVVAARMAIEYGQLRALAWVCSHFGRGALTEHSMSFGDVRQCIIQRLEWRIDPPAARIRLIAQFCTACTALRDAMPCRQAVCMPMALLTLSHAIRARAAPLCREARL